MKKNQANLTMALRQYSWLRERGEQHEAAMAKLKETLGADFEPVLATLKQVQSGGSSLDPMIKSQLGGLVDVLQNSADSESQRTSLALNTLVLTQTLNGLGKVIRARFFKQYAYLLVVSIIGLCVSAMYAVFVYPQLSRMSTEIRSLVTVESSPLYESGFFGYPMIFLFLTVFMLLTCILSIKSSFNLASNKNFAAPFHVLPGFASLNRSLKNSLNLGLQQAYARSGYDQEQAVSRSDGLVQVEPLAREALGIAWQMGTHEQEFAYQVQKYAVQVENSLDRMIVIWRTVLSVVVITTIVFMVSDYYRHMFFA